MCMNCGCGQPDDRHGNPDNITREDLERAAQANGQSFDQAVRNIEDASQSLRMEGSQSGQSMASQG